MKYIVEFALLFIVISMLYAQPNAFHSFYNNVLGKLVLIVAVVLLTHHSTPAGLLGVLFVIAIAQTEQEGMENKKKDDDDDSDSDDSDDSAADDSKDPKAEFVKNNCKDGKLMKDGKEVKDIKSVFPNIAFTGDDCSPCDENCQFEITASDERITAEENVRPKNSNEQISKIKKDAVKE